MASVTVELVSVERMMWRGEASIVVAQTTEGEIGVLPGHEPMLAELGESGAVIIRPIEGNVLVAAVQGGRIFLMSGFIFNKQSLEGGHLIFSEKRRF